MSFLTWALLTVTGHLQANGPRICLVTSSTARPNVGNSNCRHVGEVIVAGHYVFVAKRPTRVKVLWWDGNGYCLLYKRLHRALFRVPYDVGAGNGAAIRIDAAALAQLLAGVASNNKKEHGTDGKVHARAWLRIPAEAGHRFRAKVDTDSDARWTAVPAEGGH